jgi:hypothetical protein
VCFFFIVKTSRVELKVEHSEDEKTHSQGSVRPVVTPAAAMSRGAKSREAVVVDHVRLPSLCLYRRFPETHRGLRFTRGAENRR